PFLLRPHARGLLEVRVVADQDGIAVGRRRRREHLAELLTLPRSLFLLDSDREIQHRRHFVPPEGELRGLDRPAVRPGDDLVDTDPQSFDGYADVARHPTPVAREVPLSLATREVRLVGVDLGRVRRGVAEVDDVAAPAQRFRERLAENDVTRGSLLA